MIKQEGHFAQGKTVNRVRLSFIWHGISRDCSDYVRSCAVCSKNKCPGMKPNTTLASFHAGEPMERIHMDF